jgi:uncharacterized protein YeeX (DUF496 family)
MGLKALVKSLDEVPEELRELYVQIGEDFVLDVEDKDFKSQLQEFRTNNIDLTKQNRELSTQAQEAAALREQVEKYKDIDPERAREAISRLTDLEEKKLIDAGKLDEVVEQRVNQRIDRMRSEYEGQIQALSQKNDSLSQSADTYKGKLSELVIDHSLQQAISDVATVRQGAMRDVLARGRETWRLDDDGKPVPFGSDDNVLYGTDGKDPMSMEEWAQTLVREAGYLFEPNQGGGAPGNTKQDEAGGMAIDGMDQDSINANLEGIAAGTVQVRTS